MVFVVLDEPLLLCLLMWLVTVFSTVGNNTRGGGSHSDSKGRWWQNVPLNKVVGGEYSQEEEVGEAASLEFGSLVASGSREWGLPTGYDRITQIFQIKYLKTILTQVFLILILCHTKIEKKKSMGVGWFAFSSFFLFFFCSTVKCHPSHPSHAACLSYLSFSPVLLKGDQVMRTNSIFQYEPNKSDLAWKD